MTVFYVTSMAAVVLEIPRERFDHARTLRMGEWHVVWELVVLGTFALLMAAHGRCVSTDMMLGDREHAMWQLACARAMDDDELDTVAGRLFAYFDDPQHSGVAVTGTA